MTASTIHQRMLADKAARERAGYEQAAREALAAIEGGRLVVPEGLADQIRRVVCGYEEGVR